jgi:hypothetical protein
MPDELVSVMMPAYNAEAFIKQAINSLVDQSYPNWELIVVDDGSTDGTAGAAAGYDDPRIKLVQQSNRGESAARNMALKHMKGRFIAFLDADDLYLPDHLEKSVGFLIENPQLDAVYTDGYYCDSSGKLLATLASRRRGPFQGNIFAEVVRGSDLFGPPVSVVLQRELIVEQKLQFDEAITIGPDWVFLMQYAASGHFGYVDEPTCVYRLHETNISLRVNLQRRAKELAKCRMRSVQMDGFDACPIDVRANVFHDLLVNLLRDLPEEQTRVTQWPQFQGLPNGEQARLLRLMASKALMSDQSKKEYARVWLERSCELDPSDFRSRILLGLYALHPQLPKKLLAYRYAKEIDPLTIAPFADITFSTSQETRKQDTAP